MKLAQPFPGSVELVRVTLGSRGCGNPGLYGKTPSEYKTSFAQTLASLIPSENTSPKIVTRVGCHRAETTADSG